ncbi:hypothetical protein D9756_003861 [Leucocoprinus leucothites]|uniref:Uncharacterized protein n=1 Tax=Leucocoprinus leucothites TaxID=201217 RepID=A0A8H5FZR7_9AGAR|nr:hypothetical protein D9756_003861 [Leucoagaricus leucothites]
MTTVSPKTVPRRPPSASPTPASSIARGATARSAVSPRVTSSLNSAASRRTPSKATQPPPLNSDANEALVASLRQETDQKEQLLIQLQNKDQNIASLTGEVESLTSALHTIETRLNELYTEQARSEAELAQRIDIAEKLRAQVRELEKEKRDLQRRYNEQTTTFEAERQAFYDNEQHLKSRIQSLSEALKRAEEAVKEVPEPQYDEIREQEAPSKHISNAPAPKQDLNDPENEPVEITALKLELSTLATSHSSLQSTLVLLQSQLMDLKRVNNELQEENESYMILLREKTLNGQFDLMRQVGTSNAISEDEDEDDETDDNAEQHTDVGSLRSIGRSTLDRVDEEGEGVDGHTDDGITLEDDLEKPRFSRQSSRQGRKRTNSTHETQGESLADLPITGPGLDLAAELGRAESKDMLEGTTNLEEQGVYSGKSRRSKKGSDGRKVSGSTDSSHLNPVVSAEMETMRSEIKSLKDANKALSLYASKIIDRIIAQEGFEHVLAVDYEKAPQTPSASTFPGSGTKQSNAVVSKARPQSLFIGKSASAGSSAVDSGASSPNPVAPTRPPMSNPKANRRSLSFDWRNISLFNNTTEKKPELRPLTLKPGSTTLSNARKLDTEEDDEDRKERERLNATMKLMGIQPALQSPMPPAVPPSGPIERSQSDTPATATTNRRFSFFGFVGKNADTSSDGASVHSTPAANQLSNGDGIQEFGTSNSASLTQEALEHAEAENSLAALDAHERKLSVELAKGGSGGFTEIAPRQGRRSKRSAGGSGSTVWSAGMSAADE